MRRTKHGRIGKLTFDLRCIRNPGCIPPPLPSDDPLWGVWQFTGTEATTDCPADVAQLVASHTDAPVEFRFVPKDAGFAACLDGYPWFDDRIGTLDAAGFHIDSGMCCAFGSADTLVDFSRQVSGDLPSANTAAVSVHYDLFRSLGHCEYTIRGSMVRSDPDCSMDADCVAHDACARCVSGHCVPLPDCTWLGTPF
jgi:hypothetical protein